jgi:hypothetical protein
MLHIFWKVFQHLVVLKCIYIIQYTICEGAYTWWRLLRMKSFHFYVYYVISVSRCTNKPISRCVL